MWLKWLPWKFVLGYVARAHGFLDPIGVLASLHRFAQPSEVGEPIELLRAGVVFHARGLINSRVIQHNLDWVWPYWIERQFDPADESFIPRAFSITHINMTHRNWTAVGLPDAPETPVVDPRGLVTPFYDGWSLDFWIITDDGRHLIPSRLLECEQVLDLSGGLTIVTRAAEGNLALETRVEVERDGARHNLRISATGSADAKAWLAVALRPYNPEGVSFIHDVAPAPGRAGWLVDGKRAVDFSAPPQWSAVSRYKDGDVYLKLPTPSEARSIRCDVGMATAAALFPINPGAPASVIVSVPIHDPAKPDKQAIPIADPTHGAVKSHPVAWDDALHGLCELSAPDPLFQRLYDAHLRTLILHSPNDAFPGPYTYKRFWFRDSAFIMRAMLAAGMFDRVERGLDRFAPRQTRAGYFRSQDGEWDSNGEALWIYERYCDQTGRAPKPAWRDAIERGAQWINRKRLSDSLNSPHAGLFPAGFSAEHLGPNDYYYWDDFWGVAGLRSAAAIMDAYGEPDKAERLRLDADDFMRAIERSLKLAEEKIGRPAMPASPHRRLDAGAIGSLVVGYPLQLWRADEPRLVDCVEFLLERCMVGGGFFQDMIHSGVNPYLTLHIAQVLMRAGDPRHEALTRSTAEMASPTGQWPEAVHPRTRGGCMGDGQHVWAAAEWIMMIRNAFVFEEDGEERGGELVLGAGVPRAWIDSGEPIRFGPAPTSFGEITVTIQKQSGDRSRAGAGAGTRVEWAAKWRAMPARIRVALAGHEVVEADPEAGSATPRCL